MSLFVGNLAFVELAKQKKISYILGNDEDVLGRLVQCGNKAKATDVFRSAEKLNIDKEKTRDLVVGLYRTIFFPFESMPVHEPLPVWRQRQVLGFLKSLTSPNAATLEKIIKQWAQETDRDLDILGGGR